MRLTKQYEHGVVMTLEAQFRDVLQKLAAYEDAEEQGWLVILPCKVGDKVRDKIADHITALGEFREITLCQDCEAELEKWIEDYTCEALSGCTHEA